MHVRFGNLDFTVTTEGGLVQAPAAVQPLHSAGLDVIAETLEELQLHALEARAPGSDLLLGFDYGRLERQLGAFLDPDHPRRTCATSPSRSPTSWRSMLEESRSL